MLLKKIFSLLLTFGLLTSAFSQQKFKTIFVKGSSNNNLEVLDWGGQGKPILFLAGLSNTAHIFETFAPKFINNYRVFGITRRGFGKSERVSTGFDTDTLVQDILKVMAKLSLKKVILIGHSISGDELSTFARQYPDKVLATIFLDGAVNHAVNFDSLVGPFPQTTQLTDTFIPTYKNIQADVFRGNGFYFPKGEFNQWGTFDKNGLYIDDTTDNVSSQKVLENIKPISYKGIKCPTLVIYNNAPTAQERFRVYNFFDTANKKIADECSVRWYNYYKTQLQHYKEECKGCEVIELRKSNHFVFLSNPKETETAIRKFLNQLK